MIQPQALGAGLNTASARENQISDNYGQLSKAVDEARSLASEISQRFATVLRANPETEKDPNGGKPPEEYLVPLAHGLRELRKSLSDANAVLRSVLSRAEI